MNKLNSFNTIIEKLSGVQRFSSQFLIKKENVLEHTAQVAMICHYIGSELNAEGYQVNMGELLSKALLHDIEESVTGDVIRPVKYSSDEMYSLFKKQENVIAHNLIKSVYNDDKDVYLTWYHAKDGEEGAIVAFADTMCAMYKIRSEINDFGNKSVASAMTDTAIGTLKDKFYALDNLFPESPFIEVLLDESINMCESLGLIKRNARGSRKL